MDLINAHTNISKKLKANLRKEIIRLIRLIDKTAQQHSAKAFLVGGFVRDVLLGSVFSGDFDIAVEGDAMQVARAVVKKVGGSLVLHERFGTATAVLPWRVKSKSAGISKIKIDFATTRKEFYEKPAALPTVEFSTLKEDLFRRDFTINAMAVAIAEKNFGQLMDFFGGQKDLANKKIRVLHDASFIDDPTRILRAVRFEQRFNFRIEPHTENLIKEAIKKQMLDEIEKQRLRDELILMLKEEEPKKMFRRTAALGGLKFIHPKTHFSKGTESFFDSIRKAIPWFKQTLPAEMAPDAWLVYLMAILNGLSVKEMEKVCREFGFRKSEKMRLCSYKKDGAKVLRFLSSTKKALPSEIFKRLEPLSHEAILAIMAKSQSGNTKKHISNFFTKYNGVKLKIKGADLKALRVNAGPDFKKIFTLTLYAKLDRALKSKKQELEFVKELRKGIITK